MQIKIHNHRGYFSLLTGRDSHTSETFLVPAVLKSTGDARRNTPNIQYLRHMTSGEELPPENERTHFRGQVNVRFFISCLGEAPVHSVNADFPECVSPSLTVLNVSQLKESFYK